MNNRFEVSEATHNLDPRLTAPERFSWVAALMGASIAIAGWAYFGTLITNVRLSILLGQGLDLKQAYAQISQYDLTVSGAITYALTWACYIACGYVSAAHGRGLVYAQGTVAGLLSASFPLIMFAGPTSGNTSSLYAAMSLTAPLVLSILGAHLYARRAARKPK